MTTIFGGSRLANLRQKRISGEQPNIKNDQPLKLGLIDEPTYDPSSSFYNSRAQTRLLKGRIDRSTQKQELKFKNENINEGSSENFYKPKLSINSGNNEQFKLVLNDDPPKLDERKNSSQQQNGFKPSLKKILISRQPQKVEEVKPVTPTPPPLESQKTISIKAQPINEIPIKPAIREEQIQESKDEGLNENDLLECPEGCGRKFNRKALQKHAKACKLVFMSKRKQFNSEAKRIVTKDQAQIKKQNKAKEKKEGKGKAKFQKTGQNWKAASEDFRAAIKAIKKDEIQQDGEGQVQKQDEQMKIIPCKFCEKPFAEVFLEKHLQACAKKKQSEKKKTIKKK